MADVNYTVMSPLTHMVVIHLTHTNEHRLEAVLVHWVARTMVYCQLDSMMQMVPRAVMGL